jgi:hypothetical protein
MGTCDSSTTSEITAERPRKTLWRNDEIQWFITKEDVAEFCEANDKAPLSDNEMEKLAVFLIQELDIFELLSDAVNFARGETRRE